jgi:CRISPR-associated protein Cmr6
MEPLPSYRELKGHYAKYPNPGCILDYSLDIPSTTENASDKPEKSNQKSNPITDLIAIAVDCPVSCVYAKAYLRWKNTLNSEPSHCVCWDSRITGRLFLARGETSILETSARLHRTYGIPYLPGSMLKGLARAYALSESLSESGQRIAPTEFVDYLFGREPKNPDALNEEDNGDAGYVIFHDAWWIPSSAPTPLAKEIITPHHGEYYKTKGKDSPPRDTDSPIIAPQIAVRGAFLFAIEGVSELTGKAQALLQAALRDEGLGNRTHLGYGLFSTR